MPLDFPNSPAVGATYSPAGISKSWIYTGEQWSAITAPIEEGASVTVSDTPPSGASAGDLWFDSSSGVTSVYYDGTWVDVGGGDSGTSAGSVNGIVQCDGNGNFSAADLETLINNINMKPTSTARATGTHNGASGTILINQPCILHGLKINEDAAVDLWLYDGSVSDANEKFKASVAASSIMDVGWMDDKLLLKLPYIKFDTNLIIKTGSNPGMILHVYYTTV